MAPTMARLAILMASAGGGLCEKSVLMVVTSNDKLGDTGEQTGYYLPEAAHPYEVFHEAGVKMTWASPKGGLAPVDEGSVKAYSKDAVSMNFLKKAKKFETKKLSDVDTEKFDAIFVVGGYGVMWDLVGNKNLEKIAATTYDNNGVVSGVCHGPAALVGVHLKDGSSLVKGKEVACFSNKEEDMVKRRKIVPETCEDSYDKAGAKYTQGKPWTDHVVESGRLITGQNPMSARSTAQAVVKAMKLKVLMVVTSNDKLGDTGEQTGYYLPEAAHPYEVFHDAGVQMTWASPKGGVAPIDAGSIKAYAKDKQSMNFLKAAAKYQTKKLSDVESEKFDAIFVVGGYGVMWDLVGNKDLEKIAANTYEEGGVVSGVCHGPAALVGVKLDDGSSLVKGKEVACFSNAEEDQVKRRKIVPETCEDAYGKAGAEYTQGKPWTDHVARAGRLITGQNPMSAKTTAEAVVKALGGGKTSDNEEKWSMVQPIQAGQAQFAVMPLLGALSLLAFAAVFVKMGGIRMLSKSQTTQVNDLELLAEAEADIE